MAVLPLSGSFRPAAWNAVFSVVTKKDFPMSNTEEHYEENLPSRQVKVEFDEELGTGEVPLHESYVPITLLEKDVIRPVLHKMIFLTAIQLALLLVLLVTNITNILRRDDDRVIFIYAFPTMVTLALSLLLWKRHVWAIWMTLVLSFVPLLLGLLIFLLFPMARFEEGETMTEIAYIITTMVLRLLYAPVVIVSCVWALDRYRTLTG